MRLIHTSKDQVKARKLSAFLGAEGVENQLEITSNKDWGSDEYGDTNCTLWVINEDMIAKAQRLIEEFEADPSDPRIDKAITSSSPMVSEDEKGHSFEEVISPDEIITPDGRGHKQGPPGSGAQGSQAQQRINSLKGPAISATFYLIAICALLFLVDIMTSPQVKTIDTNIPITPQLSSPLKKGSLYDYPSAYTLTDTLITLYGVEQLKTPSDLPKDGQTLYAELQKTPVWHGVYEMFVRSFPTAHKKSIGPDTPSADAPQFEKIREGEFWRLITPCVMHHDILHLLFNMLWLVVLGQQMEQRLGSRRYVLFAVLVGIFSNTCQYLMSGPDFIGYSGIICGMLAFIWMRQRVAAWEGYPLQRSTINFMLFFIAAMMGLQLISLYLEINHDTTISPGIANTAHLTGAAFGAILGRLSFFSWKA